MTLSRSHGGLHWSGCPPSLSESVASRQLVPGRGSPSRTALQASTAHLGNIADSDMGLATTAPVGGDGDGAGAASAGATAATGAFGDGAGMTAIAIDDVGVSLDGGDEPAGDAGAATAAAATAAVEGNGGIQKYEFVCIAGSIPSLCTDEARSRQQKWNMDQLGDIKK